MLRRTSFTVLCVLVCAAAMTAQSGGAPDPISGLWGRTDGAGLELTFDGRSAVTGKIYVTGGTSATITSGTFNPATRQLKLAGTATSAEGRTAAFAIEGTLDGDTLALTYDFGENRGQTTLTRAGTATTAPGGTDAAATVRKRFEDVSGWVTKAADMVPADKYAYRPVSTVRTFGQLVAHIADSYNFSCSHAVGRAVDWTDAIEKGPADKATVVARLKAATDACAAAHAGGTNVDALVDNVAHTNLHYGNLVTYIRMLGLVPPSS